MCIFPSTPDVPDPEPIQQPPTMQDPNIAKSRTDAQRRRRSARGAMSTILTGGGGASPVAGGGPSARPAPAAGKTALGQ